MHRLRIRLRMLWRSFCAGTVKVFDLMAWPVAGSLAAIVIWQIFFRDH